MEKIALLLSKQAYLPLNSPQHVFDECNKLILELAMTVPASLWAAIISAMGATSWQARFDVVNHIRNMRADDLIPSTATVGVGPNFGVPPPAPKAEISVPVAANGTVQ